MILKPQDVLVLLKLSVLKDHVWSYVGLAKALKMSVAEVHDGIKRAIAARLFNPETKRPIRRALEAFLIHGVKYAYPPEKGGPTRGLLTAYAAHPLKGWIFQGDDLPPVWPYPEGEETGYAFSPLFKSVPAAVQGDEKGYELLVLVDAIRDGRARERDDAVEQLRLRLRLRESPSVRIVVGSLDPHTF
jgi:hypothetical protein